RVLQIATLIADIGDLEQAAPGQTLRNRKAIAVGVGLAVIPAVDRTGRGWSRGEGDVRQILRQQLLVPDAIRRQGHTLRARRRIESGGELTGVVVESAPTTAQNGVALTRQIVGDSESRLPEDGSHGESAHWNRRIPAVPLESAEGRRARAARVTVLR